MRVICQLNQVHFQAGRATRFSCQSMSIRTGGTVLLGQSGSGKTSLLQLLAGFSRAQRGTITWSLEDQKRLPCFWAPDDDGLWPHLTVRDHLRVVKGQLKHLREDQKRTCEDLLDGFHLARVADIKPEKLSMGEKARLNLARAFATNAQVILMDEPFSHIDTQDIQKIISFLQHWLIEHPCSYVYSTHLPQLALLLSEHAAVIQAGHLHYEGRTQSLYSDPPDRDAAWLLGPCNQFLNHDKVALQIPDAPEFLRPNQLQLQQDESSDLVLVSSQFDGFIQRSHVRMAEQEKAWELYHSPWHKPVSINGRVVLKITRDHQRI